MNNTTSDAVLEAPATINHQPSTKQAVITWETNYNNKMACTGFIHIDLKPGKVPVRSSVENSIIDIYTADNSHPPVKTKIFDMVFITLKNMPCAFTLASHGMDEMEFADYIINKHQGKINLHTEVAVYYYKKLV